MPTPLGILAKGAIAGAAGTAAMDLFQYLQYRAGGGNDGPVSWEFSSVTGWDGAPAPAQIGKRIFEALFARDLPDRVANRVNNVMHWGYGISWAAALGILAGSTARTRARLGPVFGTVVFLADYVVLPPTGLYQPIWTYDAKTLGKDWASHLVYGTVSGLSLRALLGAPSS
ncbi:MAG: hypothetical protein ACRDYB_00485 [Acidimicrobiales bacterium]